MSHTVSFSVLDDCNPAYGPVHETIPDLDSKSIEQAVRNLLGNFKKSGNDPSGYYHKEINESEVQDVTNSLFSKKYYVINRFEKYYVIAFAIDYTRFEVYSKDSDKELIKWRTADSNDAVVGQISDPEYNLNPVIKLMQQINGK